MKEIPLTQGKLAIVDDDDYEWLSQWKWYLHHDYAVRNSNIGYDGCTDKHNRHQIYMHKEINKTPFGFKTDHINQNKIDNRKENLRSCNSSQNGCNVNVQSNNTTGFKGVSFMKKDKFFMAFVGKNWKHVYIGIWKDAESAAYAYNYAAFLLHGEFVVYNAVDENKIDIEKIREKVVRRLVKLNLIESDCVIE